MAVLVRGEWGGRGMPEVSQSAQTRLQSASVKGGREGGRCKRGVEAESGLLVLGWTGLGQGCVCKRVSTGGRSP